LGLGYSNSPTASRASWRVGNTSILIARPLRSVQTIVDRAAVGKSVAEALKLPGPAVNSLRPA
jgi:hypothetical protein